jgi:hypothetical protein
MVVIPSSPLLPQRRGKREILIKKQKKLTMKNITIKNIDLKKLAIATVLIATTLPLFAQDGNAGIMEANQKVRSYFESGTQLMYAVGALIGLIGAVKVYQKWNAGDQDTSKVAAAWFGSCVFLVVVATIIKSFFGL